MILRRIGTAIKCQDWFVVLVELLIVVVGIYIGLQVDDWTTARQDRKDEREFYIQLHDDLMLAQLRASRLLDRRLNLSADLASATDVLFERAGRDEFTAKECEAIGNSRFLNIVIADLPALTALLASGRLGIVEDADLRSSVISLQQLADGIKVMIPFNTATRVDLPNEFPELISATSYYDEDLGEYQEFYECDHEGMRKSPGFRNGISVNMDGYDAYLRDGLIPWNEQFKEVHNKVDAELGISHETETE